MAPNTVSASRTIHVPVQDALAVLQEPSKLVRLSPLVVAVEQSSTDPNLYKIIERKPVLGLIHLTTHLSVRFTFIDDGVHTITEASSVFSTVKLSQEWRARAQGEETCKVTSTAVLLEATTFLKPFIISTWDSQLETLAKQLEGRNDAIRDSLTKKTSFVVPQAAALIGLVLTIWFTLCNDNNSLQYSYTATIAISLVFLWLAFSRLRTSDPYGSFHIALNIPPGQDPNIRPESEWLNMGYWKDTQVFPYACEALALKLIETARCLAGGHVLDVGHACGDSLLLHLRHRNVPRPASLTGITSLFSQHTRSLERIAEQQSTEVQETKVTLFCGDAIFRSESLDHPLNPRSIAPHFTTIMALDCAYHFATREIFLRQCFTRLSPGGRIALADLVVTKPLTSILRAALSRLLTVRSENMVTPSIYEAQLRTIGYADIRIEDISDNVFPGFRCFLKSKGGAWRIFELVMGWWVNAGGKFVLVSASKPEASD